ncbi:MAG: hypothetical protein ACEQSR_14080 [Candidatus Methylacidiphilales bacterium]
MKRYLIFILAILFITLGCEEENLYEKIVFNREEWLNGNERIRGKMVDDIINDSILIGKSKIEVLNLLGDQTDTIGNLSYQVDIGLKYGIMGFGGAWLFNLNIHFKLSKIKYLR